jgi:RHS repeat-associated protein
MLIRTRFFRFVTFITLFALLYTSTEGYVYAQEIQKDQLIKDQKAKEQKVRIEKQYGEIKKAGPKTLAQALSDLESALQRTAQSNADIGARTVALSDVREKIAAVKLIRESVKARLQQTESAIKQHNLPAIAAQRQKDASDLFDQQYGKIESELTDLSDQIGKNAGTEAASSSNQLLQHLRDLRAGYKKAAKKPLSKEERQLPHGIARPATRSRIGGSSASPKKSSVTSGSSRGGSTARPTASTSSPVSSTTQPSSASSPLSPLSSPSSPLSPTEEDPSGSIDVLATNLNHNPARIYWWVVNNIAFVPTYGSIQGAAATLENRRGNSVDQSSLLIAMYRASGIAAKYVHGKINVPADQAKGWVGTDDINRAVEIFNRNGTLAGLTYSGGSVAAVEVEHTWVRAYVSYAPNRGMTNGTPDRWVDLNPSFKTVSNPERKDIANEIGVDPLTFLSQIKNQSTIKDAEGSVTNVPDQFITDKIDQWGKAVQGYAEANGLNPKSIYGNAVVNPKDEIILPLKLPFQVTTEYGEEDNIGDAYKNSIHIDLQDSTQTTSLSYDGILSQLYAKRITLSYVPATADDAAIIESFKTADSLPAYLIHVKPQLKIEGDTVAEGTAIGLGYKQTLNVNLQSLTLLPNRMNEQITAGAYTAITVDLQGMDQRAVTSRIGKIRLAKQKLENHDASDLDGSVGEMLTLAGRSYFYELDTLNNDAAGSLAVRAIRQPSSLITTQDIETSELFGVPFEASAGPVAMSVSGDRMSAVSETGNAAAEKQFLVVSGLTASVLEHIVLEQVFGGEATSTIRQMQTANTGQVPIYTFKPGNTANMGTDLTGLPPNVVEDITDWVNFGYQATAPRDESTFAGFHGAGYIIFEPQSGESGYFLPGGLAGGIKTQDRIKPNAILTADPNADYLGLVSPGVEWMTLASGVLDEAAYRYIPAVASIAKWFENTTSIDNITFLASGIALSGPLSLVSGRPGIGQVIVTPKILSPNNDGRNDTATILASISRESNWQVQVIDQSQIIKKTFTGTGQSINLQWNGTDQNNATLQDGDYTIRITATAVGLSTPALPQETTIKIDNTLPTATIEVPQANAKVNGTVSVIGTADDANFSSYTLEVGSGSSPSSYTKIQSSESITIDNSLGLWETDRIANGTYTLHLKAEDKAGNISEATRTVITNNANQDLDTPQIHITAPLDRATVTGNITITATATDNIAVTKVEFLLDGSQIREFNTTPYSTDLDTQTIINGTHKLTAKAYDAKGNVGTDEITVTTDNYISEYKANPNPFTPNGDGYNDITSLSAKLKEIVDWNLTIKNASNTTIKTLTGHGSQVLRSWDGKTDSNTDAPTGQYTTMLTANSASASITIGLERTEQPPFVEIATPAEAAKLTTRVEVIGTVTDTNLTSWTLEQKQYGQDAAITIGQGTTAVRNGRLGYFDPTTLQNDHYDLILTAEDATGRIVSITRPIWADGELKIGNMKFSQQDLTVPLEGLPITVVRSYDSFSRNKLGDFGYGWTLSFADLELKDDGVYALATDPINPGPPIKVRNGGGRDVTLTLPDGRRTTFTFVIGSHTSPEDPFTHKVFYNAQPGVHYTLTPNGSGSVILMTVPELNRWSTGTLDEGLDNFEVRGYTLTTKEGIKYIVDRGCTYGVRTVFVGGEPRDISAVCGEAKLSKIIDRNGNEITFANNEIRHKNGVAITITRKPGTNLISDISGPDGNSYHYEYDSATNDLLSVRDPEGNTTSFIYDSSHNIKDIIAPNGKRPLTNEYDAQGRLVSHTDSFGNKIKYTHNTDARQEIVTDRMGNPSVYGYDENGLVTSITDAFGNVTKYEYDANKNKTKETDALGNVTKFMYDAKGNLTSQVHPLGHETKQTYDSFGNLLTTTDPNGHTTTNSYDSKGNLTKTIDAMGNATNNTYDAGGNMLTSTDALGNITSYAYNGSGYMTSQTDPLGHLTVYTYDSRGNQLTQTQTRTPSGGGSQTLMSRNEYDRNNRLRKSYDPLNHYTETIYNEIGQVSQSIDKNQNGITNDYDSQGQLKQVTYADGTSESYVYDKNGRRMAVTDRGGNTTQTVYDVIGRAAKQIHADGTYTQTQYDTVGRVVASINEINQTTRYEYDVAGRRAKVIDALGHETTFEYDAAGNQKRIKDALGRMTKFEYDAANRRIKTIFPDQTFTFTTYDQVGRKIAETDQAGKTTQYVYCSACSGRLDNVIDAAGKETIYTYDEVGNQVVQQDAEGRITKFEYDELGRRTKRSLPLSNGHNSEIISYDPNGNLLTKTDINGETITLSYDVNNRPQTKTFTRAGTTPVSYTYYRSGQQNTITDASGTTTFLYDNRYRLKSETKPDGKVISYEYDTVGNRTKITVPSGSTTYRYDVLNRLQTVTDQGGKTTAYTYDVVGNRASVAYPNDTSAHYTYDPLNRLMLLENKKGADIFSSYLYQLGFAGNRTKVTESTGRTVDYNYDSLYRLTSETIGDVGAPSKTISYTYDDVGNRLTKTDVGALTSYTYNDNDQLETETTGTGVTTYAYDFNGNTTSKAAPGQTTTYSWDQENRMVGSLLPDGRSLTYRYDHDGIRVSSSMNDVATNFLVDKNQPYAQVLEEYSGNTLSRSYTYGDDLISQAIPGGAVSFYHYDGQMSTRQLTAGSGSNSGDMTDAFTYDAFGMLLASTGSTPNNYLYTGEQLDGNVGFYYLRARYYNQKIGSFLSLDTFHGSLSEPISLHKYLYANADPVNKLDPTGMFSLLEMSAVAAVIGILILVGITVHTNLKNYLPSAGHRIDKQARIKPFYVKNSSWGKNHDEMENQLWEARRIISQTGVLLLWDQPISIDESVVPLNVDAPIFLNTTYNLFNQYGVVPVVFTDRIGNAGYQGISTFKYHRGSMIFYYSGASYYQVTAHELGHSLGKLGDITEFSFDNIKNLMYEDTGPSSLGLPGENLTQPQIEDFRHGVDKLP